MGALKGKTKQEKIDIKSFVLLAVLSLLAVMCLELWKAQTQTSWQADSEALVWCRVADAQKRGILTDGGLLRFCKLSDSVTLGTIGKLYGQDALPHEMGSTYLKQSGLQGTLDACLAVTLQTFGIENASIQKTIWILNSTAFVFCILLVCWWILKEFGWIAAAGAASCVLLSPWLENTMANAYWVIWTMFLPFAVAAYIGWEQSTSGFIKRRWYVVLFICVLVRFLCGFEFTSTVMLATEVPLLYYFLKEKELNKKKQWIQIAFWVGVLELAAFGVAVGITVIQIMASQQQGVVSAVNCILDAVKYRTGAMVEQSDLQRYEEAVVNSLEVSRLTVVKRYLTSSESVWNTWSIGKLLFFWLISAICCKAAGCFSGRKLVKQGILLAFSMISAISLYFLASGHAYIHTTIDYLLWMLPFVPLCVGCMFKNFFDTVCVIIREEKAHGEL